MKKKKNSENFTFMWERGRYFIKDIRRCKEYNISLINVHSNAIDFLLAILFVGLEVKTQ